MEFRHLLSISDQVATQPSGVHGQLLSDQALACRVDPGQNLEAVRRTGPGGILKLAVLSLVELIGLFQAGEGVLHCRFAPSVKPKHPKCSRGWGNRRIHSFTALLAQDLSRWKLKNLWMQSLPCCFLEHVLQRAESCRRNMYLWFRIPQT